VKKKLLIIAGEESGDLHGSALIHELNKIDSNIEIHGIGGDKMINSGMNVRYHINEMSFLGFIEIIKHLPFIRKVKKDLIEFAKISKIKNIVLIDYPGFNLSIAKSFHKLGLKNIYYISPQIWAWGGGRIKKIKKIINRMIVFFPFEKKIYLNQNICSDFVGHPLVKSIDEYNFLTGEEIYSKYKLDPHRKILLLLPGSRKQELDKIFFPVLEAAEKLSEEFNLQTVVACADNIKESYFLELNKKYHFTLVKGNTYDFLNISKLAIVKSGTSTLETGIIGTPFIVVYKTNYLTYLIGKILIKIKNIALANIVAEENVVTELIQSAVNPSRIYNECKVLLSNETKYSDLQLRLRKIKDKLKTEGNPSRKAAEIIYSELNAI